MDPIATFTRQHPVTGDKQTRDAYSPAEAVNLRADGWVEKSSKPTTSSSTSTGGAGTRSSSSSTAPNN